MTDQELHGCCLAWANWCFTRRYFAPPLPKNILARMQPVDRVAVAPDGPMDADMAFFNMAVHGLAQDMPSEYACFALFYVHRVPNVKAVAAELGIGRRTYYERMRRFARKAYTLTASVRSIHEQHMAAGAREVSIGDPRHDATLSVDHDAPAD